MTNENSPVSALRRPRLLVRAARLGIADYDRDRDLRRLIGAARAPSPQSAISRLMEAEDLLESFRKAGDASYSVLRHVEVLIALMAEVRLLPKREAAVR